MWPADLTDPLVAPASTDFMDDTGKEGDVVGQLIVDMLRAFIAEYGANPSGAAATLAARLDGMFDTNAGGTFTGPVTFTGVGAFLTLAGDPTAALHAVPKQYVDTIVNALFPGGIVAGSPNDGDTWVYRTSDGKWHLTATGL